MGLCVALTGIIWCVCAPCAFDVRHTLAASPPTYFSCILSASNPQRASSTACCRSMAVEPEKVIEATTTAIVTFSGRLASSFALFVPGNLWIASVLRFDRGFHVMWSLDK